jgi:hypothetical protein
MKKNSTEIFVVNEELRKKELALSDLSQRCSVILNDLRESDLYDSAERMSAVVNTLQSEVAMRIGEGRGMKSGREGWVWLGNTSDYHYFKKGRSLCRRWTIPTSPKFSAREIGRAYNCLACVTAFKKSGNPMR